MRRILSVGLLAVGVVIVCMILPRKANTLKNVEFPKFEPPHILQSPGAGRGGFADIILTNGQIYTMDPAHPWASAVAMRGETIIGVEYLAAPTGSASAAPGTQQPGSPDVLKNFRNRTTRVIDLHGQFAMPGFNDAHVHLAEAAYFKNSVNMVATTSLADFEQRLRVNLSFYKPGEWIVGRGWDHTLWPRKAFPTRDDLDSVATGNPIFCERIDGHVAVVNSRALEIAGITAKTPDPPGGHIERDPATGQPTGLLEEDAAMELVASHIPPHSQLLRARLFAQVFAEASKYGVTSIQDNSVMAMQENDDYGWQNFNVLAQMKKQGNLPVRVTEWLPFDAPLDTLQQMRTSGGTTDPWLKTGALKTHLDGSLGSRTAAMLAPYSDSTKTSGIVIENPATLGPMAIERDKAGFQLAFHAIGDRANRLALDTFAAVVAANGARDRRFRIEHAQVVAPEDMERFGKLDVVASMQPAHLLDDARWADARLGPSRSRGAYAWETLEKSGAHLAFGTDYPNYESIDPLQGIYACVTRQMIDGTPAKGWQPQERLPIDACLRYYTTGSAYAEYTEQSKGVIGQGYLADIVVYPVNLLQIPPPQLLKTNVVMTIAGGKIRYTASAPSQSSAQ
jgi:predicted amidohydrolase YtcJ